MTQERQIFCAVEDLLKQKLFKNNVYRTVSSLWAATAAKYLENFLIVERHV